MGEAAVREILEKIDRLPEADRLELEKQLADRSEAQWLEEARLARDGARARGIDQAAVDRAVEETRYAPRQNGDRG